MTTSSSDNSRCRSTLRGALQEGSSGRIVLGVRPESFEDASFAPGDLPGIDVDVVVLEELGSDAHVFFHVDAPRSRHEALEADVEDEATLVGRTEGAAERTGRPAHARRVWAVRCGSAVDPARFHFFDPETGASLLEHGTRLRDPAPLAP